MNFRRGVCIGVALAVAIAASMVPLRAATIMRTFQPEPTTWPAGSWFKWKTAFLQPDGRIVDNVNGDISHSEGQGYGMLLAVMANDPDAFASIWGWTRTKLMTRPDGLAAWRWDPAKTPKITDPNNASDGDLMIAWALTEAAERFSKSEYQHEAQRIATALDRAAGMRSGFGRVLLPGVDGFTIEHRATEGDGPVVNPSYWIFPALDRLSHTAPWVDWGGYRASGYTLLKATRFGTAGISTDWVSIKGGVAAPAIGFPPTFSYNAVRIPLYLAWGAHDSKDLLAPYVAHFTANGGKVFEYDVEKKANSREMSDPGYVAILSLAKCAFDGEPIPLGLRSVSFDRYYSSTLHMLALAAARLRFDKCL